MSYATPREAQDAAVEAALIALRAAGMLESDRSIGTGLSVTPTDEPSGHRLGRTAHVVVTPGGPDVGDVHSALIQAGLDIEYSAGAAWSVFVDPPEPVDANCGTCGGSGVSPSGKATCPDCEGTGEGDPPEAPVEHLDSGVEIPVEDDGHADEFVETHAPATHPAILDATAAAGHRGDEARELCFRQQGALRVAYNVQAAGGNAMQIVSGYLTSMRESEPATAPSESVEDRSAPAPATDDIAGRDAATSAALEDAANAMRAALRLMPNHVESTYGGSDAARISEMVRAADMLIIREGC